MDEGSDPGQERCPLPHCLKTALCAGRVASGLQALPILGTDLLCQMLTQCLRSVCPKIVVEIPEPRFEHPNDNPDLGGSGGQSLRCALPGWVAVDGNVPTLHSLRQ